MRRLAVLISLVATLLASQTFRATAQDATPGARLDVPDPAECTVAPRELAPLRELFRDVLAASGDTAGSPSSFPQTVRRADTATVDAVTATMRELVACINAGDNLRLFALFTDNRIRQQMTDGVARGMTEDLFVSIMSTVTPLAPRDRLAMPDVRDIQVLADGRVGAIVTGDEGGEMSFTTSLIAFAMVGDRWLIDEAVDPRHTGVAQATPSAAEVPDPSECTIAPRPIDELRVLWKDAVAAAGATPATATDFVVPAGEPADAATVAGVSATMRELVACINAGDYQRVFAFYTDRHVREIFAYDNSTGSTEANEFGFLSQASPLPEGARMALLAIDDVRLLGDSRVGAIASDAPGAASTYLAFAKVGDRWLIDESVELPAAGAPAA